MGHDVDRCDPVRVPRWNAVCPRAGGGRSARVDRGYARVARLRAGARCMRGVVVLPRPAPRAAVSSKNTASTATASGCWCTAARPGGLAFSAGTNTRRRGRRRRLRPHASAIPPRDFSTTSVSSARRCSRSTSSRAPRSSAPCASLAPFASPKESSARSASPPTCTRHSPVVRRSSTAPPTPAARCSSSAKVATQPHRRRAHRHQGLLLGCRRHARRDRRVVLPDRTPRHRRNGARCGMDACRRRLGNSA